MVIYRTISRRGDRRIAAIESPVGQAERGRNSQEN